MIEVRSVYTPLLGKDKDGQLSYLEEHLMPAWQYHGFHGEEKVVHNCEIYYKAENQTIFGWLTNRWNDPVWAEKNSLNGFLNQIMPKALKRELNIRRGGFSV